MYTNAKVNNKLCIQIFTIDLNSECISRIIFSITGLTLFVTDVIPVYRNDQY